MPKNRLFPNKERRRSPWSPRETHYQYASYDPNLCGDWSSDVESCLGTIATQNAIYLAPTVASATSSSDSCELYSLSPDDNPGYAEAMARGGQAAIRFKVLGRPDTPIPI